MCLRFFISKEWIVSATARRIYLGATILNITLFFILFSVPADMSAALNIILGLLLFICAMGTATTYIAMLFHFVLFNKYSISKSILCALTLFLYPIGPPVYFFVVYWRSPEFRMPSPSAALAGTGA
jgi:hypothetical protein